MAKSAKAIYNHSVEYTVRSIVMNRNKSSRSSQQGGVGIRVVFALITLCVIGAAIGYFLYDSQQQLKENYRKAGRISEYGLQTALEEINAHPSWKTGYEKIPYDDGWYSVMLRAQTRNDTALLNVTSEGHIGNASDARECLLALTIENGDSIWIQRSMH
jgi:hypothetical protein